MPTADSPEALAAAIARLTDEGASVAEVSKATGLSDNGSGALPRAIGSSCSHPAQHAGSR
jgi:hypothetical protein